jgi:hypothetical protein
MNSPEKIKEWSKKISDFNRSGKNKKDWCEENNVSVQQFAYWYGRISKNQATQWLPVEIIQKETEIADPAIQERTKKLPPLNIKVGIASIEVNHGFDKELLLDILKILKIL